MKGSFIEGFKLAALGRQFLKSHRTLWRWILWPLALNFFLLIAGGYFGLSFATEKIGAFFTNSVDPSSWLNWLQTPILILVGFVTILLWTFIFQSIAALILSPFYSFLIERVLTLQGFKGFENLSLWARLLLSVRILKASLLKSVLFLVMGIVLFILSFVPALNMVALYLGMCLLAADNFDLVYEAKGLNFSKRMKGLWKKRLNVMGLGLFYFICSFIPGLNLILTSFVVIGATLIESSEG